MNNCNCRTKPDCTLLAIAASIILGITAAILNYTAIITVSTTFLWVAFGIGVGFLAILLLASIGLQNIRSRCVCASLPLILTGILLTILTAVILLAIPFAATSVLLAIIIGLLVGGLSLIFASVACFIKCIANCDYCDNDYSQSKP